MRSYRNVGTSSGVYQIGAETEKVTFRRTHAIFMSLVARTTGRDVSMCTIAELSGFAAIKFMLFFGQLSVFHFADCE